MSSFLVTLRAGFPFDDDRVTVALEADSLEDARLDAQRLLDAEGVLAIESIEPRRPDPIGKILSDESDARGGRAPM